MTCLVPDGPPSWILAVQVCSVTSSMSARSAWISTPVTLLPAALISLAASSSGMPCVIQMSSPRRSSSAGSGVPSGSRASQARSARCPASSASTTWNPSSRATTGTRGSLCGPVSASLPGPGSACAMRTVITRGPGRDECRSHSLVSVGHQAVTWHRRLRRGRRQRAGLRSRAGAPGVRRPWTPHPGPAPSGTRADSTQAGRRPERSLWDDLTPEGSASHARSGNRSSSCDSVSG